MRVLVIGGTGFIGPFVVRELDRLGHQVTVLSRGQSKANLPASVARITGHRHNIADLREDFLRLAPDVVIDMILSSGGQAEALMDTFRGIARRIVALSSGDVYRACAILHGSEPGPPDPMPLTEDAPLRARPQAYPVELLRKLQQAFPWLDDEYDKIPVERAILSDPGLPGTVLRLPMVYGPGDRLHRLFPILKRIGDGRPAILLEETLAQWRAPRGYVANVAAAIALAATSDRAADRIYNVAETEAFSEFEWTTKVARAAGFRGEILTVPADRAPAHLKPPGNPAQHWVYDTTRIRAELGYREPVPLEAALRETIAWERANPLDEIDPGQFDYASEDAAIESLRL